MPDAPPFDPAKPYETVGGQVPPFDPSKPFEQVEAPAAEDIADRVNNVPQPFWDRLSYGKALDHVIAPFVSAAKGAAEGFGPEPLGMSPEHVRQLQEAGIYRDPATGRGGAIRLFNESVMQPAAVLGDVLVRGVNAGVHGIAGAVGQFVEDAHGALGNPEEAKNEVTNFANYLMLRGDHQFSRYEHGPAGPTDQNIGTLPTDRDFKTSAQVLSAPDAEANLRQLWQERGIHPAEATHDAQADAFLRHDLTTPPYDALDHSDIPAVRNSPVPVGTPRSALARTGDERIDRILDDPETKAAIDSPVVNRANDVPYSAGPDNDGAGLNIDRHFPESMTVDGVTFDPAEPFAIHEFVERDVMQKLIAGGMEPATAYKVAHFDFAEKAEGAWYAAHGIDQAKAEAAYRPFIDAIDHEHPIDPPADLFRKPYPHDNVSEPGSVEDTPPTNEEVARAHAILDSAEATGAFRPLGADVAPPLPSLAQQPPMRPGRLVAAAQSAVDKLFDIGRDLQMKLAPMATGSRDSMALAKDFSNSLRRNRWEWSRVDDDIAKRFDPEQRKRMWDAADEESVARQLGESREHQGLITLEPEERRAVEDLQARAQTAWLRARDLGMVEGEGLPAYTPRMVINAAGAAEKDGRIALNRLPGQIGRNLRTRTAQMLHRKHMTAEETEAAAKAALGEGAEIARDIRVLPLATARLEDAIAGRALINNIREIGARTGDDTVADGFRPTDSEHKWFTVDHPAFRTWRPKLEQADGKWQPVRDQDGNIIFDQAPIYVRGDFEGPLRAVLSQKSGALYSAAMSLKGKTMSLIMNSPLIHNAVEWGRAVPAMPGKVATFKIYFEGNRARHDLGQMREAIDAGMVPIGHRFFNQDISSIMEEPNLTPGRSWTSQVLAFVPGLFDEAAGTAVKRAIDKAGDFWHNTLLWDRVADLQMGLYTNFRDDLLAKGIDRQTAARAAAHWANRYAGALPVEAMSAAARKVSNMLMFSRSFTLGNLGVMKDVLTGLPKDVLAQIERDAGEIDPNAIGYAKALARRKATAVVALDVGLMLVGNSILQSAVNVMRGDSTVDQEMHGYAERLSNALAAVKENPLKLLGLPQAVSATNENEPGRQDRVKIGYAKDGTAIYARNPVGKIGEEFVGYLTGPFDMMRRKLGTLARPVWQVMNNDAGFGRKIYDPDADTLPKYAMNVFRIIEHIAGSQLPEGQISAAHDLVTGQGDAKVNALQAFGPFAGVTFSKGAPGGPAVGEVYHAREMHDYAVDAALPDIRRQIQRGDIDGARQRMTELGIPPGLQKFYVRTTINPATRLSGRTLKDFYLYATPEQKQRLENAH